MKYKILLFIILNSFLVNSLSREEYLMKNYITPIFKLLIGVIIFIALLVLLIIYLIRNNKNVKKEKGILYERRCSSFIGSSPFIPGLRSKGTSRIIIYKNKLILKVGLFSKIYEIKLKEIDYVKPSDLFSLQIKHHNKNIPKYITISTGFNNDEILNIFKKLRIKT